MKKLMFVLVALLGPVVAFAEGDATKSVDYTKNQLILIWPDSSDAF